MTIEPLWTVKEVATYLRASTSWVYKAAERGTLPCVRLGAMLRFRPAEIRRFVEGAPAATNVVPLGVTLR